MGLLDDAIREHLDLKRQRGADPGEIERLERDALGPVRREPTARSMDAVPRLEVQADPEPYSEPATQLYSEPAAEPLDEDVRAREPKRGFLRRNRSALAPAPEQPDFAEHLEAGMHREADATHADLFAHDDPFAHEDPFGHGDDAPLDDPFAADEPATHEHAGPDLTGEPPLAAAATEAQASSEPAAPTEPPAPAHADAADAEQSPPTQVFSPAPPPLDTEPPHLIFKSAPPPPKRPTFLPIPTSIADPEPADLVGSEPDVEQNPGAAIAPVAPVGPAAPVPNAPPLDERVRADAARETREWDVEEAFAAEDTSRSEPGADPPEEDVLEETPEFLQDTPDHDRLWFEQRPPRDFDFDG